MDKRVIGIVGCVVGLVGCANQVAQDRATGPDGRIKGARAVALQDNEGRARGIVTYPGGDRVDWKSIQLPEGKRGVLDLRVSYTTPRPGLRVAFDVFDQWHTPIVLASTRGGRGRSRSTKIDKAAGTYFVRIYAPRRGDAGAYKLVAAFKPEQDGGDPLAIDVPPPPKLPAVPEEPLPSVTPPPVTPPPVTPPPVTPPPVTTPAPPAAEPITVRKLKVETVGGSLEVTLPVGSAQGVTTGWKARVLRGDTNAPLAGGTGTIVRVNNRTTIVRVSLTPDQLSANPNINLAP